MSLAYSANAFVYDADSRCYALRADFDPDLHRVEIEFGEASPWAIGPDAAWNDPCDPPIAHVRHLLGTPLYSGHTYVSDRFRLTAPNGESFRIDTMEIDHDVVAYVAETPMLPGHSYPLDDDFEKQSRPCEALEIPSGFGPGTLISTPEGDLPIEWLTPGDRVMTYDQGPQALRWIGYRRVTARQMAVQPKLGAICLEAGQCGPDSPDQRLILTPDTRVLLEGADVQLHFGIDAALAQAGELAEPSSAQLPAGSLTYFTLLFDRQVVVRANGLWCASLFADSSDLQAIAPSGPKPPVEIRHSETAHRYLRTWETQLWRVLAPQRALTASRDQSRDRASHQTNRSAA